MNPFTLPVLLTIAIIGAVAIILVKLLYEDKEDELEYNSQGLDLAIENEWEEPMIDRSEDFEKKEEYSFVSKSWEEPMEKPPKPENGVASKVFHEPLHSKHQQIIKNSFESVESEENLNFETSENHFYKNNDNINDPDNDSNQYKINENNEDDENIPDLYDKRFDSYESYEDIKKYENDDLKIDDSAIYSDDKNEKEIDDSDLDIDDSFFENIGGFEVGEVIVIDGESKIINVGDEIIFKYNGESYSSQILEIKHQNVRVKYRNQEKWINLTDIKKIF